MPELLRASHIRPSAECETEAEHLDVYDGLLLAPHLDTASDRGSITVADDGEVIISAELDVTARITLGLHKPIRVQVLRSHRFIVHS